MRRNNWQNKHSIIIFLLAFSLILQGCNLGSTGDTKNSTLESVKLETSTSSTTEDVVLETTTTTTTPETTIDAPSEPYQVEFTHKDVSFLVPGNKIMAADTDIKTAVDPVLTYPWQLVNDPAQAEFMKYVHDKLLDPDIKLYGVVESFFVDISHFKGKIPNYLIEGLVSTVLSSEPRFFAYENLVWFDEDETYNAIGVFANAKPQYKNTNAIEASAENYQDVIDEVKAIAQNIMDTTSNTWQRILMAQQYIIYRVDYDPGALGDHTKNNIYDALLGEDKLTKCVGYAQAFALILAAMQIDATVLSGMAELPHAWNLVFFEDSWYSVDVTADDLGPIHPDLAYLHRSDASSFLLGSETMLISLKPHIDVEMSLTDNHSGYEQLGVYFESTTEIELGFTEFLNKINLDDNVVDAFDFIYTGDFDFDIFTQIFTEAIENSKYRSIELEVDWMAIGNLMTLYILG